MSPRPPSQWLFSLVREKLPGRFAGFDTDSPPVELLDAWAQIAEHVALSEADLAKIVAGHFDLKLAPTQPPSYETLSLVPESVARHHGVCPLSVDNNHLVLATANPVDQDMMSTLTFVSSHPLELRVAPPSVIESWINIGYGGGHQEDDWQAPRTSDTPSVKAAHVGEDSAVARLVQRMVGEAAALNASDIHAEPYAGGGVIRYRIDGMLRRITTLPKPVFEHIVRRIKAIGGMNQSNHLIPQDGSTRFDHGEESLDLRLSTLPVVGGEKVVIRLLKPMSVPTLDSLSLDEQELKTLERLLANRSGIFFMTGPTGSGKTTTLYSAISEMNQSERCLVTVEDPVEYNIEGIAQVGINPTQGLSFARALKSILRQDPDVVMVGEVRDEETADIAMRAALTGHFVLSTLHTNDAVLAIPRLRDLGISETIIADALVGLGAQRLVRKLCVHCATEVEQPETALEKRFAEMTGQPPRLRASGCRRCNHLGYSGRFPLLEILLVNDAIATAIRSGAPLEELRTIARQSGMRTLTDLGRAAATDGRTSAEELHRVLGESAWQ